MKKWIVALLFLALTAGPAFAGGDQNRGETGTGATSTGTSAQGTGSQSRAGR